MHNYIGYKQVLQVQMNNDTINIYLQKRSLDLIINHISRCKDSQSYTQHHHKSAHLTKIARL